MYTYTIVYIYYCKYIYIMPCVSSNVPASWHDLSTPPILRTPGADKGGVGELSFSFLNSMVYGVSTWCVNIVCFWMFMDVCDV